MSIRACGSDEQTLQNGRHCQIAFHDDLRAQGLSPRDLGARRWADVRLSGRRSAVDLPSRRLFYWSNRFLPWASSRFFAEVTKAFEEVLGAGFPIRSTSTTFWVGFTSREPSATITTRMIPMSPWDSTTGSNSVARAVVRPTNSPIIRGWNRTGVSTLS